jgi:hypothetical protein
MPSVELNNYSQLRINRPVSCPVGWTESVWLAGQSCDTDGS